MASITREYGALLGTVFPSEILIEIANNATETGSVKDVLEDDESIGEVWLYAVILSTVTDGSIDIKINPQIQAAGGYARPAFEISIPPVDGTVRVPLGKRPSPRRLNVEVKNNDTGAAAHVGIFYELEKVS